MFNAFVWQLYKESERGKKVLKRCSRFSDALHDGAYSSLLFGLSFDEVPSDYPAPDAVSIDLIGTVKELAAQTRVDGLQQATLLFETLVSSGIPLRFPDEAETTVLTEEDLTDLIQDVSVGLHLAHPEHFIPYGFRTSFADLQRIGELFNLALPPVPGKKDIAGRGRYYAQLNQAFHEFRQSYGLSTVEMCAFLYDFAPRFLVESNDALPEPSKVWLITGGTGQNGDFEWLEEAVADETSTSHWQGNLNTRQGDILLMYGVTPHSYIHSIWRATTDGFVDPFFYYHSTVWIGQPIKTVPVTFKEMKADPLLSQKGAIKAHLQGPSGKPFTLEEYDAILGIMEAKGQDITDIPRPKVVQFLGNTELVNERDVETALVEPLLARLGYSEKDWLRQMPLRMGRGERIYPDYVFGAQTARGEERADMVLEAKFTIGSEKVLRETYLQAVSCAYRLRAKLVLLAAREGLWTFKQKRESFSLNRHDFYPWDALQHADTLFELRKSLVKPRR
jgi:hypothetical protein